LCGSTSTPVARTLGVCLACIRQRSNEVEPLVTAAHAAARAPYGLPPSQPRASGGAACRLCANQCVIADGERGYCGLRAAQDGRLRHLAGTPDRGVLHWYRDPLPTNCVADWVCSGAQQRGKHNLAVFYASCTFDCLFCQNWHFRDVDPLVAQTVSAQELADSATRQTYCACFFGGDPASQMVHALASGRRLAKNGVVVCWETNGSMHPGLADQAVELSLATGGCVKFDLKALDQHLHRALTGCTNQQTLANFSRAAGRFAERPDPPLVVASTLLVPGYVDADEVARIAAFIADLDPRIPYSLLAFGPKFQFYDLPYTSSRLAQEAHDAALDAGLTRVRVANRHLLDR
jgi:pyruvate formate lyase activating enzyme